MPGGINLGQNPGKYRKENCHKTRAKCFRALVTFIFKVNFKNGWNCGWLHYILLFCLSYYLYKAVIYPCCGLLRITRLCCWDSWMRTATEMQDATSIDMHLLALSFSILCRKASLKNRKEKKEFQSFQLATEPVCLKPRYSFLCVCLICVPLLFKW